MRISIGFLVLLSGCGLTNEGPFPSLQPRAGEQARVIQPPGAAGSASLSPEERATLAADISRTARELADARRDISSAEAELAPALKAASGAPVGSEAWSVAQLKLSRFDQARSPLAEISSRIGPSRLTVDSLAADDPDRMRLLALDREADALLKQTSARADAANRALARS